VQACTDNRALTAHDFYAAIGHLNAGAIKAAAAKSASARREQQSSIPAEIRYRANCCKICAIFQKLDRSITVHIRCGRRRRAPSLAICAPVDHAGGREECYASSGEDR
jgi:hypothetical protein